MFDFKDKRCMSYMLSAFLVFALGFFVFHERIARSTGSWNYLISHDDDYGYWSITAGFAADPVSDVNPFYYEDRGKSFPFPVTATAQVTGTLSRLLKVPVLFFLPFWKIFMPFFLWLTLWICLVKFWDCPVSGAAAAAMILLLGTLFLEGQVQFTLLRYFRPGDALWLAVIWISVIMNPEKTGRWMIPSMLGLFALTLFLNPYFVLLGISVLLGEGAWQVFAAKKRKIGCVYGGLFAVFFLSMFAYFKALQGALSASPWLQHIAKEDVGNINLASILLFSMLVFFVGRAHAKIRMPFSKLDRLLIVVFGLDLILANLNPLMHSGFQISSHRYYYGVIYIAVLSGWMAEKMRFQAARPEFRRQGLFLLAIMFVFAIALLFFPQTRCLRIPLARSANSAGALDLSFIGLGIFPLLYLIFYPAFKFQLPAKRRRHVFGIGIVILLMAVCGFRFSYGTFRETFRVSVFDGAYGWLKDHAHPNDVVLNVPPASLNFDYLPLVSPLKSYLNYPVGQVLTLNQPQANYRLSFYFALLLDALNHMTIGGKESLPDKLRHLRLDYILINLPSPFRERIERQLSGYLENVYEDPECLLWRVKSANAPVDFIL